MTIVSDTDDLGAIYFADGVNGNQRYNGYIQYEQSAERFTFGTGAAFRVAITGTGIGLGTTAPAAKIHSISSGSTYAGHFESTSNTPYGVWVEEPAGASVGSGYPLLFVTSNGGSASYLRTDSGGQTLIHKLSVSSANTSFDFYNNGTTYLNGATTVDATLTVSGSSNLIIPQGQLFYLDGGSNTYMYSDTSDSIAIATGGSVRMTLNNSGTTLSGNLTVNTRITFSGGSNQYLEIGTDAISLKSSGGSVLWNSASSGSGSGTVSETHAAQTNHEVAVHLGDNEVGEAHRLWYNYNSGTSGLTVNAASPETDSTYSLYVAGGIKSTTGGLHITGDGYISSRIGVATAVDTSYGIKVAGYIASYGHTTWSDQRLKDDTSIWDTSEAATLVKQYSEMAIVPVLKPKYPTPLAWLTPQEDQVWINYLNHWIKIKKAQGFFDLMMDKYSLKSL